MNAISAQYESLLAKVLNAGTYKSDRTGTGTVSIFAAQLRYNLEFGFPLITTKKVHFKSVVHELLWFLSGSTNVKYLKDNGVTIWDAWADENGDLGPVYGAQWRSWPVRNTYVKDTGEPVVHSEHSIDQIANLVKQIKKNPDSRRLIVSAWNPAQVDDMALPPCHCLFQFYVARGRLSCQLYQRSADLFLGVPFNVASYALLTHMVAQQCDLGVGDFIWTGGDCHLYLNHLDQAKEQIWRDPYPFPTLKLNRAPSIFEYKFEDIQLENYQHHPAIKAPVAV